MILNEFLGINYLFPLSVACFPIDNFADSLTRSGDVKEIGALGSAGRFKLMRFLFKEDVSFDSMAIHALHILLHY